MAGINYRDGSRASATLPFIAEPYGLAQQRKRTDRAELWRLIQQVSERRNVPVAGNNKNALHIGPEYPREVMSHVEVPRVPLSEELRPSVIVPLSRRQVPTKHAKRVTTV